MIFSEGYDDCFDVANARFNWTMGSITVGSVCVAMAA
jgi:hypothetical protein